MDDRRAARRFDLALPLQVRVAPEEQETTAAGQTRDISHRGIYFVVDRELSPGSPIEFTLTLPKEVTLAGDVQVRCGGRIVRVESLAKEDPKVGGLGSEGLGVAAVIERYDFFPSSS